MKKLLAAAAISLPLLASAQNLLQNGSFEQGFTSWTVVGTGVYPPSIGTYGTAFAFGEVVPVNDAVSISPDPVGTQGVYFVDDVAAQSVSQTVNIANMGDYLAGFDYYIPLNGSLNPGNAFLIVTFGTSIVGAFTVNAVPVADWVNVATTFNAVTPGDYTFTFAFTPLGNAGVSFGKDVVIDRAFIVAVPEPTTYALFGAGLAFVSLLASRRSKRDQA